MNENFFFKELEEIDGYYKIETDVGFKKVSTKYGSYFLQSYDSGELMKCIVQLKAFQLIEFMKTVKKGL